jgi:hypothetical protein
MSKIFFYLCFSLVLFSSFVVSSESFGYTYQNKDGNPFLAGTGDFPDSQILDIPLSGTPRWISTITDELYLYCLAVLDDGVIQVFRVKDGTYEELPAEENQFTTNRRPPLLQLEKGKLKLIEAPSGDTGDTHPVQLENQSLVYIGQDNTVKVDGKSSRIYALPDARLLLDENDRILFLSDPTERYDHGVLGDSVEAGGVFMISPGRGNTARQIITMDNFSVIEGIKPLWVDLNGDGIREILVTESNHQRGASLVLYNESGEILANGPSTGSGYRWRHQLAAGPFGAHGEMEIVADKTPHIGGPVEFYRWRGNKLEIVATIGGFSSHVLGSRNLDMIISGDFDGNSIPEIIIPSRDRRELGSIERTENDAVVKYTLKLDSVLVSNLSGFILKGSGLGIAAGLSNNSIRIWY